MIKKIAPLSILLFVSISLNAQAPDPALPELAWLTGYWTSTEDGTTIEELWTNGAGYMMLGVHRDVNENGRSSFEYLRIMRTREGIVYVASPGGKLGTTFTMIENIDQKVVFENLDHDFPQRIIYSRSGDTLTARIEDESGEKSMEWVWTKTKPKF
ncbi:MAG TPA: hypothetical protein DEO59_01225 [Balneola sp.]|mgnify:FL=1|jgi:hypothetical protein|nr:hypothetical protein [Balneola sp.]MAO77798.1 hypothetical protein [Balneola sp.]MBF63252.1 hypothetical protein [Balneola sp.]HAW80401.1 hypothetical protein [Balneola sp.]HBZ37133.1 hypothetical protein [Balneola sp.]|tara:strand:- start:6127 stop:6594 length:468 start_codon:yes stop_codon:yes gene_type:complete